MPKKKKGYKAKIVIGPPRLTSFERARIIGIRAIQLDYGAEPFIPLEKPTSTIEIAQKELEARVLPLSIKRKLPFKEDFEPIPVNWLLLAEEEDKRVEL
jgi:DNA-directed RNA polymerase subunit K/omega